MRKKGHKNDVVGNVLIYLDDVAGRLQHMENNKQYVSGIKAAELKAAVVRLDNYYKRMKRKLKIMMLLNWIAFFVYLTAISFLVM